jgi:alanyl-tRNA synthetase
MDKNLPITKRLYYQDSHLLNFSAQVLSCQPYKEHWAVTLDQTAFYPTGGGQPNDTGLLGNAKLVDCIDETDHILHIVDNPVSGTITGKIDSARRLDHLQQHTGQHILSQAFIQVAKAETRGFHLGVESATIDLEIDQLSPEIITKAEDLANQIIFENRPIHIHLTDEKEKFPLRKDTERETCIRIIEITDFDHSPCGGTHAKHTGEVGMIVVRSIERAKKMWRVEFICGQRVLQDYRLAHSNAMATAKLFSATRETAPSLVAKLQQDFKDLQKRNRELLQIALNTEANSLYQASPTNSKGIKVVQAVFNRDLEELKILAHLLTAQSSIVTLLATTAESPKVIFARSKDVDIDCGKLLSQFCKQFDGRGGGRPDFAQGGLPISSAFEKELEKLASSLS